MPMTRIRCRLIAAVLALGAFYCSEWTSLRNAVGGSVGVLLSVLGDAPGSFESGTEPVLVVRDTRFAVTRNCTYASLFLVLAPFCLDRRRSPVVNLRRVLLLAGVLFMVNALRIAVAIELYERGTPWTLGHDVPDIAIHLIAGLLGLSAARRATQTDSDVAEPPCGPARARWG
jgi:hypothetical protein